MSDIQDYTIDSGSASAAPWLVNDYLNITIGQSNYDGKISSIVLGSNGNVSPYQDASGQIINLTQDITGYWNYVSSTGVTNYDGTTTWCTLNLMDSSLTTSGIPVKSGDIISIRLTSAQDTGMGDGNTWGSWNYMEDPTGNANWIGNNSGFTGSESMYIRVYLESNATLPSPTPTPTPSMTPYASSLNDSYCVLLNEQLEGFEHIGWTPGTWKMRGVEYSSYLPLQYTVLSGDNQTEIVFDLETGVKYDTGTTYDHLDGALLYVSREHDFTLIQTDAAISNATEGWLLSSTPPHYSDLQDQTIDQWLSGALSGIEFVDTQQTYQITGQYDLGSGAVFEKSDKFLFQSGDDGGSYGIIFDKDVLATPHQTYTDDAFVLELSDYDITDVNNTNVTNGDCTLAKIGRAHV